MKRTLFVLDAHTNGHEAAVGFISQLGWNPADCNLVFCGTHEHVLNHLTSGPAYAVVAIENSIAGPVTDVVQHLASLRDAGYALEEVARLQQPIAHCLVAPAHVEHASDVQWVFSHPKAFQQCRVFLSSIGITPEQEGEKPSTAAAAKAVSKIDQHTPFPFAAIASKAAAEAYGLRILAEHIEDRSDNTTAFVLLENKADVKPVTVGIIGLNGRFGSMLATFFKKLGCTVIGADPSIPGSFSNDEIVRASDVVIFSTPISETPGIIRDVIPFIRPEQLLMDVTSIKQPAVEAMLESPAQVVGLHPMFRPELPFQGQTIIVCKARLTDPSWKTWVVNMLAATGATCTESTATEHDQYMLAVQVIPHLGNLVSALLLTESGIAIDKSLSFTSPLYRILFSLMGRLVSQNPKLYTAIVMDNPATIESLEHRIAIEQKLLAMVRDRDTDGFEDLFRQAREHFGEAVTTEANELFVRINSVLSTLYGADSVTLEFTTDDSKPGLLERVAGVFTQHGVNLTGINSVQLDRGVQFTISFEQPRNSEAVCAALDTFETWTDPRVNVC